MKVKAVCAPQLYASTMTFDRNVDDATIGEVEQIRSTARSRKQRRYQLTVAPPVSNARVIIG
jgi:hypothetical protein